MKASFLLIEQWGCKRVPECFRLRLNGTRFTWKWQRMTLILPLFHPKFQFAYFTSCRCEWHWLLSPLPRSPSRAPEILNLASFSHVSSSYINILITYPSWVAFSSSALESISSLNPEAWFPYLHCDYSFSELRCRLSTDEVSTWSFWEWWKQNGTGHLHIKLYISQMTWWGNFTNEIKFLLHQ